MYTSAHSVEYLFRVLGFTEASNQSIIVSVLPLPSNIKQELGYDKRYIPNRHMPQDATDLGIGYRDSSNTSIASHK